LKWEAVHDSKAAIAECYRLMSPQLNERQRRRFAATEARTFGRGGIAAAHRDAQFAHINQSVGRGDCGGAAGDQYRYQPEGARRRVQNAGREWHPAGQAPKANTHDFPSMADGKAIPYGVYDIADDVGFVSVGIDRDTAQFSVAAVAACGSSWARPPTRTRRA